jgi:hypothetical protein
MLQFFHSAALTASAIVAWAVFLGSNVVYAAPSDEEAVRKVVNEFPEAWNRHDMNAFGARSPQMLTSLMSWGFVGRVEKRSS